MKSNAYIRGWQQSFLHTTLEDNPHPIESIEYKDWKEGWLEGRNNGEAWRKALFTGEVKWK
jgi:hypothetical protein